MNNYIPTLYTKKYAKEKTQEQMEKDFQIVARTLRANNASEDLCWEMAQEFKKLNNSFDVNRFMKNLSLIHI